MLDDAPALVYCVVYEYDRFNELQGRYSQNYPEKGRFLRKLPFDFDALRTECAFCHYKYTLVTAIHYDGRFVRKLSPFLLHRK